jgi:hypothetical protein
MPASATCIFGGHLQTRSLLELDGTMAERQITKALSKPDQEGCLCWQPPLPGQQVWKHQQHLVGPGAAAA